MERNVAVEINNRINAGKIKRDSVVFIVDVNDHLCDELAYWKEDFFFHEDSNYNVIKMRSNGMYDSYLVTNSTRDSMELEAELKKYDSFVAEDGWIYDVTNTEAIEVGYEADLYYNGLWDEGDIRKNIQFIAEKDSNYPEEILNLLPNEDLADLFWETWCNR